MKRITLFLLIVHLTSKLFAQTFIIIDHHCTDFLKIPVSYVDSAVSKLHIAYGHTSHGSQIIQGMTGILDQYGSAYDFKDGSIGALDIDNNFVPGDLGNPDFKTWATRTRTYLNNPSNSNVNVVIWSWCNEVGSASEDSINVYLSLMSQLELDFPAVRFIYMTGHLEGNGVTGNLNMRNEQIRAYCKNNNKTLFDFADIESYDPNGLVNYMNLRANDNCDYDSDNNGTRDANWAIQWCNVNPDKCFYTGDCAHSQALNCQQKGIAAWWLWARLAGWNGNSTAIPVKAITISGAEGSTTISTNDGTLQLSAFVLPADATNKTITWSITNGTGQASITKEGLVTAISNGTVTVKARANDGSGISGTLVLTISNQTIPVTGITVTSLGGLTSITSQHGTLQLIATVLPVNASINKVNWSVNNVTGSASINDTGLLEAISDGTVTAVATAADGSNVKGILDILIQNQYLPVYVSENQRELFISQMNKSEILIQLPTQVHFRYINLYGMTGDLLCTKNVEGDFCTMDVSALPPGIYVLLFSSSKGKVELVKIHK